MNSIPSIVEAQKSFFYTDTTKEIGFRKKQLNLLKQALKAKEQALYEALKADLGKPIFESFVAEFGYLLRDIDHTLAHMDLWAERERVADTVITFPSKGFIYKEPYGVVLVISPWNYPLQLALAPAIGAIAAGNTVVIKPSEFAPHVAEVISDLCSENFDPEFLVTVQGGVEETQTLLKQPIDYLFFTGSPAVAKHIMKPVGEQLIPHTLELGGKSPCIVDKSANISLSAKRIVYGKFFNAGQTCIAPDYVLVDKEVAQQLLDAMKVAVRNLFGDDPKTSDDYGRIIHQNHLKKLTGYLSSGKVEIGGEVDEHSLYLAPTVLSNVGFEDPVMQDEIFGPILPVLTYQKEEEIVPVVRRFEKPLAFYHFTKNGKLKNQLIRQLNFGGGVINDTLEHLIHRELPFGGVGQSGIGAYHGKYSFETFSHRKSILQKSSWIDLPLKYPPYGKKLNLIRKLFKIS